MNSLPAAAASGRPKTGAATKRWPASECAAASLSDNSTLIVLMEMWMAPLPRAAYHAVIAERYAFNGAVVSQHRDDGLAPAGVRSPDRRDARLAPLAPCILAGVRL